MSKRVSVLLTCMGCGQNKECYTSKFGIQKGTNKVQRITRLGTGDSNESNLWHTIQYCSLCEDCILPIARGTYNWLLWLLGISFLFSLLGMYILFTGNSVGIMLVLFGYLLSIIGVTSGFSKLWGHNDGKDAGALWFGIFFGWTQIPTIILFFCYKKLQRVAWADKLLKEAYIQKTGYKENKGNQALAQASDKGANDTARTDKYIIEKTSDHKTAITRPDKGYSRYNKSGICDVCGASILPGEGYMIPVAAFYSSYKYKNWLRSSPMLIMSGLDTDSYIRFMKSLDNTTHSVVCDRCLEMF